MIARTREPLRSAGGRVACWRQVLGIASVVACLTVPYAGADAELGYDLETSVKAAFVYRMLEYVDWSPGEEPSDGPIVIGVLGADDLELALRETTRGRTVNERAIRVVSVDRVSALDELQVLVVGDRASPRLPRFVQPSRRQGVLLISESDRALERGSIINFRIVDGRVRFEVSLDAADASGLKLSSRLLSVAYRIVGTANANS